MKYIELNMEKTQVNTIFPEFDPTFPDMAAELRYTQEYLAACIKVEDEIEVEPGDLYDIEKNIFIKPQELYLSKE